MDPFFAKNRLSAYIDDTLSPEERAEVQRAIEQTPELRAEYQAMRRAVDLLHQHGPQSAPSGFHARVMAQIADEPGPSGLVWRVRALFSRVPVEAVALAAAAALVVLIAKGRHQGPEVATPLAPQASATAQPSVTDQAPPPETPTAPLSTEASAPPAPSPTPTAPTTSPTTKQTKKLPEVTTVRSVPGVSSGRAPYIPEWDKDGGPADDSQSPSPQLSTPLGFKITLAGPDVLFSLDELAREHGGKLLDAGGRPYKAHQLDVENAYASVHIVVPQAQAEAVQRGLEELHASSFVPPQAPPLHGEGQAGFWVEVAYQP